MSNEDAEFLRSLATKAAKKQPYTADEIERMTRCANELDARCDHQWRIIETVRRTHHNPGGLITWTCVDRFYCWSCLDRRELKKEETASEQPAWW